MSKPDAPRERVSVNVTLLVEDRDYLDRRAADFGNDQGDALHRVITEARTFRHDLRGKLGALDLIEMCLTSDAMTRKEAAELIAGLRHEIRELIDGVAREE